MSIGRGWLAAGLPVLGAGTAGASLGGKLDWTEYDAGEEED